MVIFSRFSDIQMICVRLGENREDIIDEQEMENYLTIVMAVQKLMQNELSLLSTVIPVQHQHQVFQIIIQDALDAVVQDGEVLIKSLYSNSHLETFSIIHK